MNLDDTARRGLGESRYGQPSFDWSADWYKEVLDSVDDIVVVLDRKLRHVFVNKAALRLPGLSEHQIIGKRVQEVFPGVENSPLFAALQQVRSTGQRQTVTHELGLFEKPGRWYEDRLFPTDDVIVIIGVDITERKLAEDALRQSEERFRTLFEQSLDAIFLVKPDGTAIEANQAWLDLFGYTTEELPHINARDTYADPADRDSFLERIHRYGFVRDEVRLKRKDGTIFDCERHVVALKDHFGTIIALQGVHRDVTERKRAEQKLRESEGRFRSLFDHSIDAIFVATAEGHIIEANQAWLDMFQYTREDLSSLDASDLHVSASDRQELLTAIAEKGAIRDETYYRRKDGTEFPARRTAVGLRDETGKVVLYQGIVYDITELRQAEERETEQRLLANALMETSPACIVVFDVNRRIVFANAETDRVLGISREQVVGGICGEDIRLLDMDGESISDDELPACRVFTTEAPMYSVEYGFDSPTGRRILSVSAAPLYDEEGSVARVVATIEDVTGAKHREQTLRDAEERSRGLYERSLDMVILTDLEGRVVDANPATAQTTGYSLVEMSGRPISEVAPIEDQDIAMQMLSTIVTGHSLQRPASFRVRRPDGTIVYVEVNASLVLRGGTPIGVEVVAHDVSEHRRREQEQEEAFHRLRQALNATVQAMIAAVEMRDPYTAGHQVRVTTVACAIAEELRMPDDVLQALRLAGQVHDLGKIRVPVEILTKPGRITDAEYRLTQEHPQASFELLKGIKFPWPVAEIARQHHERLDGSGYPQGLKGDQMEPEARILAVADVFEAMSSHRPYRAALGMDAALEELEAGKGTLYDPDAVEALARLVREKGFRLE